MPVGDYEVPLGKARLARSGSDITLLGWGAQVHVLMRAAEQAEKQMGVQCEVIGTCMCMIHTSS